MKKFLSSFLSKLSLLEGWLAILSVTAMTFLVVLDVFARELFNSGFPWAQKGAVFLMIWAGYLGAILVSSKASHLRPQIADKLWQKMGQEKGELWFVRVQNLVTLLFCAMFSYAAFYYVMDSHALGDRSVVTGIPLWVLQLVIPYTFLSMALRNIYFMLYPKEQLLIAKELH